MHGRWCPQNQGPERGSSTVEAVLILPVIMLLLLLVVQGALWAHAAQVAQLAASEGDRAARAVGGGPAAGLATARSVVEGPGSDMAASRATTTTVADQIRITVTGHALGIVPGLTLPVSATEVGSVQTFRASE